METGGPKEIPELVWVADLEADLRETLIKRGSIRELPQGTWLWVEGDEETGLVGVLEGALEIHASTPGDQQVLISLMPPGSMFGQSKFFGGGPRLITAVSACPTKIFVVTDSVLKEIAAKHPDLWPRLTGLLYDQLRTMLRALTASILHSPRTRLIGSLLVFSGMGRYPVPLSQEKFAEMLGASRIAVNGWLKELEASGAISRGYGEIHIADPHRLEAIASETLNRPWDAQDTKLPHRHDG